MLHSNFNLMSVFVLIFLLVAPTVSKANSQVFSQSDNQTERPVWERIKIPEAQCGNGESYKVFLRRGKSRSLAFGFSGGGACWNAQTCFGPFATTSLKSVDNLDKKNNEGIFSTLPKKSALAEYTHIWFPYCTGDVFLGTHDANYGGKKVHHQGRVLVEKTLQFLVEQEVLDLESAEEVVLYGFSAGAIGALYHVNTFEPYTNHVPHKVVISDSPGLHFGPNFWNKFTSRQLEDFAKALKAMDMVWNKNDGHVAAQIPKFCSKFSSWRIGVLQGSKDFVMSMIFGNISTQRHHNLVFGENGLYQLTERPGDNCSAWVPETTRHTFLSSDSSSNSFICKKSAIAFANDLVWGGEDRNYRGVFGSGSNPGEDQDC